MPNRDSSLAAHFAKCLDVQEPLSSDKSLLLARSRTGEAHWSCFASVPMHNVGHAPLPSPYHSRWMHISSQANRDQTWLIGICAFKLTTVSEVSATRAQIAALIPHGYLIYPRRVPIASDFPHALALVISTHPRSYFDSSHNCASLASNGGLFTLS